MSKKGENSALWEIVGSVVGAIPRVRSRVISVGFAVAVAVGIAVASIPTTVSILSPSTCCASSVGSGVRANFVDEMAVLLQKLINLLLLLVYLALLFPDDLPQIVIFSRHLLYVLFVANFHYRYFAEIGC